MPDPILMAKAAAFAALAAVALAVSIGRFHGSGGAIGVCVGILVGAWTLGQLPKMPPREALDRLLVVLLPMAVLAEAAAAGRAGWLRWTVRAAVAAVAAPVLVQGSSYVADLSGPDSREWTPERTAIVFVGLATALALAWVALTGLAVAADRTAAVAVAVTAAGAGVTVMLSGYASGGQLGLPLAAAVVAIALVGGRQAVGAVGVAVVGLFGLLVVGWLFAGLTLRNAAVLFSAPLLAWLPELPRVRRLVPRLRGGLRIGLTTVPVIIVLVFAFQKFTADSAGPSPQPSPGEPTLSDYLEYGK